MDWALAIKFAHIIGTALGVGGATLGEVFYLKAARDGKVDPHENDALRTIFYVLRVGMALLIISGFGYFIMLRLEGHTTPLLGARMWAKLTIVLILLFGVVAWHTRKVPMWLGSAISLTSWYAALIIGAWRGIPGTYVSLMLWYAGAIVMVGIVLLIIRWALKVKE